MYGAGRAGEGENRRPVHVNAQLFREPTGVRPAPTYGEIGKALLQGQGILGNPIPLVAAQPREVFSLECRPARKDGDSTDFTAEVGRHRAGCIAAAVSGLL